MSDSPPTFFMRDTGPDADALALREAAGGARQQRSRQALAELARHRAACGA